MIGAVLLLAMAMAAIFPAAGSAAAKSPFRPGLYVGKTSQGYPVKLRLVVGDDQACSGRPCLYAPSDEDEIYVAESCNAPEASANEYLSLFGDLVTRSGAVHADQEGFSKTTATIKVGHGGSLAGKVRSTSTLEGGIKCDSGAVTFSAKIGGSVR
ncbi:MAG: hypothetical protein JSS68_06705 [Actinobacteria bacterium]|nr:hypothetical protein [Actinomycetota bacterium]